MQADKLLHKSHNKAFVATIGIDLMGSDRSPLELFPAVLEASKALGPFYRLVVFLSKEAHSQISPFHSAHVHFHFVSEVIEMEDEPLVAIRKKKDSSIVVAIRQLKKKQIDAFVSLGNTGALIASATLILPLLPGIRRPALLAVLPAAMGKISVLDVGGSVSCKAPHLVRFALMGACFARVHFGIFEPNIGLLNVGAESKKGTTEHRRTYQILQEISKESSQLKFIGNVEGSTVFEGEAHVIVTDGFAGNVLLKTAEGIASYILQFLKKTSEKKALDAFKSNFSGEGHPGAILLGVEGVVIKCHGDSSFLTLSSGIKAAASYIQKGLIQKLKGELDTFSKALLE